LPLQLALAACAGTAPEVAASDDEAVGACPASTRAEVILWTEDAWLMDVASRLTPDAKCMDWFVAIPLQAADKTQFHPNVKDEIAQVHTLGSNFHALAEFNWAAWEQWVAAGHGDWKQAASTFREEMDDAGFVTFEGNSDTWLVQEFPTTLVDGSNGEPAAVVREHAVDVVRTLHDGGKVHKLGATTRAGVASHQTNVYGMVADRGNLEDLLSDTDFWQQMSQHVRWWGEEVYAEPRDMCVGGVDVAERAVHIDDFVFHMPRLAEANPGATSAARAFFAKSFTPWLNGAWDTDGGYGDVRVTADQMRQFVSTQVYATRAWARSHDVPGGRMAWSWSPMSGEPHADIDGITARLAASIDDAYDPTSGAASRACSPSGAWTFCQCDVPGASFLDSWSRVFGAWN
jgi:hypothetical protein